MGKYADILTNVFRLKFDPQKPSNQVEFNREDLDEAARQLGRDIRNMPDAPYYLRSRARRLPPAITEAGFTTLMSVGKGRFRLTKEENQIKLPDRIEERKLDGYKIPRLVREVLLRDEQSILSAINYTNLMSNFLKAACYHVQDHLRTIGPLKQQVEADAVYVGEKDGTKFVVSVEAKGEREKLGYSQMRSTINAVQSKFDGYPVKAVGIHYRASGKILALEFDYTMKGREVDKITLKHSAIYSVEPTPLSWKNSKASRMS